MTTPARYCCTLQQSKRLRELGVDADTLFCHRRIGEEWHTIFWSHGVICDEIYPAYTVGELGEMLKEYDNWHQHTHGSMPRYYNDGIIWYWGVQDTTIAWGNNEAQSRAFLLIHLLENNLITPSQVNNQLK